MIFVDEMGSNINLYRKYGRAPKGHRIYQKISKKRIKNQTLVGAIGIDGFKGELIFEGAMTKEIFEIYVEKVLCPVLKPDQTVIMDNLSSHKNPKIRVLIEAVGCHLKYLPTYSPDFNPIEHSFSKLKTYLRQVGAREKESLHRAISEGLKRISHQDCWGWFKNCGYPHQPL